MKHVICSWSLFLIFLCLLCLESEAWGPRTESSIVVAAAQLLSKENAVPFNKVIDHIRAGADISPDNLKTLLPDAETDPIRAITDEMALLQTVHGSSIDPYLAFRLGVLGKIVARITAPMLTADPRYRTLYFADVESNIGNVGLIARPRRDVDPALYFPAVQREAAARQVVIEKEYQSGIGFRGVASQALDQDVSRSINAVADVWFTILRGQSQVINVSQPRVRQYYVDAIEYHLSRRNVSEASLAYEKLIALGGHSLDIRKRIADLFFEAQQYDRAIEEYRAILELQPARKDVQQKLSEYYKKRGDEAMKVGKLEAAREAYQSAAEVDRLDPQAQELLLEAERKINDREERLKAAQTALEKAFEVEKDAEEKVKRGDYTAAMSALTEAERLYANVTDEFPEERRAAQNGINNIIKRRNQLRDELLRNAQNFSGSGSSGDVQILIRELLNELQKESLQELLNQITTSTIRNLSQQKKQNLLP